MILNGSLRSRQQLSASLNRPTFVAGSNAAQHTRAEREGFGGARTKGMDLAATLAKDCYTPQHPGNVTTVWARWGGTKHGIWTADVAPYSRWSDGFKEVDHTTPLTLGKWNTVANSPGNTCNGMPTKNLCTSVSRNVRSRQSTPTQTAAQEAGTEV